MQYAALHIVQMNTCHACAQVSADHVAKIKACGPLLRVIKTLKESNIEFLTVDTRTLVTDHPLAAVRRVWLDTV